MKRALVCLSLVALAACRGAVEERRVIVSPAAPAPIGPYSQAVLAGDTLYLAGQLGIDPATGELVPGGIAEQTRQALENCRAILRAAGFDLADVVQVQALLEDLDDYPAFNRVYAEFFPRQPPARATFAVRQLPRNARVEIVVTAVRSRRGR